MRRYESQYGPQLPSQAADDGPFSSQNQTRTAREAETQPRHNVQTATQPLEGAPGESRRSDRSANAEQQAATLPLVDTAIQFVSFQTTAEEPQSQRQPNTERDRPEIEYETRDHPEIFGCSPTGMSDSDGEHDAADNPVIDGMVEYMESSPDEVPAEAPFGTSSTFDFALQIKASTAARGASSAISGNRVNSPRGKANTTAAPAILPPDSTQPLGLSTTMKPQQESQAQQDDFEALKSYLNRSYLQYVPQRMVAKALLDRYFHAVHPVWPFLIEETTRHQFDLTWSSDDPPCPMWMAQLNLVFALACQYYDSEAGAPLPDVYDVGKQCYLRAHGFILAHAFNTCNVQMVQTLLLVAQYQQGTLRSNECWLTTGHVTRMALGLGFHTSPPTSSGLQPLEIELRKRLWWGCFSLDR